MIVFFVWRINSELYRRSGDRLLMWVVIKMVVFVFCYKIDILFNDMILKLVSYLRLFLFCFEGCVFKVKMEEVWSGEVGLLEV